MNEMGTKCFDILSMFHGWLLRVLLQYSSSLLILISHYSIDCLCLQRDSHTSFYAQMCQSTLEFVIRLVRDGLQDVACLCVCVSDVFINVYPPPWGALKFHIFVSFWLFFSLGRKTLIHSAFSSSTNKH